MDNLKEFLKKYLNDYNQAWYDRNIEELKEYYDVEGNRLIYFDNHKNNDTYTVEEHLAQLAYTTSKWALRGTSYNLQLELKKYNCRVIQLNVGGMNTRMHEKYTGTKIENPDAWMNPRDIADIMLYALKLPKKIEISELTINRKNV